MFLKFLLLSFLAINAVQAYEVKPVYYNDSRDLNDIIKQITDVINKLKDKISEFQQALIHAVEQLEQSIKDAISKIDIAGIVNKIEDALENILKQNGIDASAAKACIDTAKTETDKIVQNTQESLKTCLVKVDDVIRELNDKRLEIEAQGQKILAHGKDIVVQCIKDHPIPTETVKCLIDQFSGLKQEISNFVENVSNFVTSAQKLVSDSAEELNGCVTNVAKSTESQVSSLIENFKKCVSDLIPNPQPRVTIQEIIEQLKKIIEAIIDNIKNIITEVPALIKELEEKIKQFIKDFDINKIIDEIKKKLEQILHDAGIDPAAVPECIKAAETEGEAAAKESYNETKACVTKVDDVLRELKDRILEFEEKAKNLIETVNNQIATCVKKPIAEIIPCLKGLVDPVKQDFERLAAEMKEFITQAKEVVEKAGTEFVSCMSNVNTNLIAKEKEIFDNFKTCIKPKFFFM